MTEPIRRVTPEFAELYPEHAKFFGLDVGAVLAVRRFVYSLEPTITNSFGAKLTIDGHTMHDPVLKHFGIDRQVIESERLLMTMNAIEAGTCPEITT